MEETGENEASFCIVITKSDVSKMRRAKKNASWTYRRDVVRWMGEMSVSNTPFPEEMGGQMPTRGIMLD